MKVLFILSKDVYNIPAVKIAEEMLKRGYQLDFYAEYLDHIHIRMFEKLNISINTLSSFDVNSVDKYDFIYSALTLGALPFLWSIKKYVFHFTTTPFDEPNGYGDFTFTQRDMNIYFQDELFCSAEKIKEIKSQPGEYVGNPKYDYNDAEKIQEKKQILFVDTGHFPFGCEGKMEEAKMLLEIAEYFPDYRLLIKPRFLPEDKNVTHRNGIFLYDCLNSLTDGNLPSNVEYIMEHVDLEEKVRESQIVITPDVTSTYLDIGAYNKKGIVAYNLPNDVDSVIFNEGHTKRMRKISHRSGLCVPYKDIIHYLPEGKIFNERHKEEMGLNKKDVAKHIVDIMEHIYETYILKDVYPGDGMRVFGKNKDLKTIDQVISMRYAKSLFSLFETYKYRIEELNFGEIEEYILKLLKESEQINENNYAIYKEKVEQNVRNVILSNKDILMGNAMKQSYYLEVLYQSEKIQFEREEDYSAKEMFWCLRGKYEIIKKENAEKALSYFEKFFDKISQNEYEKTLADFEYYKQSAIYWSGVSCYKLNRIKEATKAFEALVKMTDNKHKKAAEYLLLIADKNTKLNEVS